MCGCVDGCVSGGYIDVWVCGWMCEWWMCVGCRVYKCPIIQVKLNRLLSPILPSQQKMGVAPWNLTDHYPLPLVYYQQSVLP